MGVAVILNGQPIGDSGSPRVIANSVQITADDASGITGPASASFTLTWEPRDPMPALDPFTPVQIDIDGHRAFSGRVRLPNITGYSAAVTCDGTKVGLAGPLVSVLGLDTDLTNWQGYTTLMGDVGAFYDARPNTDVPSGPGAELVSQTSQGITLTWPASPPAGHVMNSEQAVVAVNVAWPFQAVAMLIAVSFSGSIAGRFRVWGTNQLLPVATRSDWWDMPDTGSGAFFLTPLQPFRYLKFGWGWTTSTSTPGGIATVNAVWLSGQAGAWFQTATDLARKVAIFVPELSSDLSQAVETPTALGQAAWPTPGVTPASILTELASYDDPLVGVDAQDRLIFQPRATVPILELSTSTPPISEAPSDPSVLVADVLVSGTDTAGRPYSARFNPLDLPETPAKVAAGVSVPNAWVAGVGSTLTGAGGWPGAGGYLEWRGPGGTGDVPTGAYMFVNLTGTFLAGKPYLFTFGVGETLAYVAIKEAIVAHTLDVDVYDLNDLPGIAEKQIRVPVGSNGQFSISWTPRLTTSSAVLAFNNQQARQAVYSDGKSPYYCRQPNPYNFAIWELAAPGPLSRQRIQVTGQVPVSTVVNDDIALAFGQSYLRGALRQGPTGVRSVGDGAARDAVSHAPLDAGSVLASVGRLARLADRSDPESGVVSPVVYVSQVVYSHATKSSEVTYGQRYGAFAETLAKVQGL